MIGLCWVSTFLCYFSVVVLQWRLSQGDIPKAALFTQSSDNKAQGDYDYGLLMLMPPTQGDEKTINKEVVYIIDTSGSMGGVAIKQAKEALNTALDLLTPNDSFNIIAFDSDTERLFALSKVANNHHINQAKKWLSSINAGGGTNMYPAIEQALTQDESDNKYRQVIFITDGSVGNEDELLTLIDNKLTNTRLHTIGIGSAPNGYFMSQAAKVGRGTYRYIGNINEVEQQMTALFNQISKPLMKNITLTWPVDSVEIFPQKIPDLYAGEPLLISARWAKSEDKKLAQGIHVSGELAATAWQEHITVSHDDDQTVNAKVAKPDVPVISVAGDGGFMFGVQELATAVQHKIGVIVLLFNNNLYGNVRQMQETLYDNRVIATDLHNPDFVKMAHAFGANGVRVNNYEDMRKAIQDAKGESLPTVIEVPIGTGLPSTNRFKALPKVR